jgi:fructoselysine-6-phosphate deglycase
MLNFDVPRFLGIQTGAMGLAAKIDEVIGNSLSQGADTIFFAGSGGAGILMQPVNSLLQTHSRFPTFCERAAELVLTGHASFSEKSIVVVPSLSGKTKESIEVIQYANARGATTISMVGSADTPVAKDSRHCFVNFAQDDTSSESFYLQSLCLALSVLKWRGETRDYERIVKELTTLPALLVEVKKAFEPRAQAFAQAIADAPYHIISGAGATYAEAYYYGMCILEEMQWILTRPVHASDFFHGTLELLEKGVSVMLFKGEDAARPLVDRAENFARNYTDKLLIIDTAEFKLPGISSDVRALISQVLLATVLERVNAHLEVIRKHPLTTRRYYKRVAY